MDQRSSASRAPDPGGEPANDGGQHGEEERYGPLALQRTHKDDGRPLIFFRDARTPSGDE